MLANRDVGGNEGKTGYTARDAAARKAYAEESAKEIGLDELTVLDIMRKIKKNEDIFASYFDLLVSL